MDSMDMRLDPALGIQTAPTTRISQRHIIAVKVLQTPSQELSGTLAHMRDTNPALDVEEYEACPYCGAGLKSAGQPCGICGKAPVSTANQNTSLSDYGDSHTSAGGAYEDDADPMLRIAAGGVRGAGLLQTLMASLADDYARIAEYLVGSLDSHGYLPNTIVTDAVAALGCERTEVERTLAALQRLDPPGIGARGARECLLLQLRSLREQGAAHPLAEALVRDYLPDLAFRRFREVAHAIGAPQKKVEAEWQFIHDHLHPYPTHGHDPDGSDIATPATPIRPDVVIRWQGTGFEADVVERQRYAVRVNPEYVWARKHVAELRCNEAERSHIRGSVDQAQSFITALHKRWETMQRVTDELIALQGDFLRYGESALHNLTRADVARSLDLHESTVSRATDGKYVLLPNGHTISFDAFFDASLPTKKALREIIAAEDPRHPLSDDHLAKLLADEGYPIARRTVAKYRDEEQILPSRLRRSHRAVETTARNRALPFAAHAR